MIEPTNEQESREQKIASTLEELRREYGGASIHLLHDPETTQFPCLVYCRPDLGFVKQEMLTLRPSAQVIRFAVDWHFRCRPLPKLACQKKNEEGSEARRRRLAEKVAAVVGGQTMLPLEEVKTLFTKALAVIGSD